MIIDMGVDLRLNCPIKSMRELLAQGGFDAVFVGSGAPKGKELKLPGREAGAANIHIGIAWLESVAFGHIDKIGERVLIIGVGNTAMDCCRTSLRLGAESVKVMARKPRGFFKASEWELEDAEEESVEIIVNRAPKAFVIENGTLTGMLFDKMEYELDGEGRITAERTAGEEFLPADDVILAIGQENAFPWIERELGIEFDKWDVPLVDKRTFQSTRAGVFFGGDAAFGPKNIIWAVEHGHQAAISIHRHCQGESVSERLAPGINLQSRKMGMHEWSYANDYTPVERRLMPHVSLKERFKKLNIEVELGFTAEQVEQEVQRCLNCDVQTVFTAKLCIECDACIDICPVDCLTITHNGAEPELRATPEGAGEESGAAAVRVRGAAADRARHGQGRGPVRALRTVRRALPDRRLGHAEVGAALAARRGRGDDPRGPETEDRLNNPCRRFRWRPPGQAKHHHDCIKPRARQRLRHQDRHRQRHGLGERQHAAHEVDLPQRHPGDGQELLPVQHPGTAHLVRDPRHQGRLRRPLRARRPHGGDERRDLRARREGGRPGRLPGVRLDLAAPGDC